MIHSRHLLLIAVLLTSSGCDALTSLTAAPSAGGVDEFGGRGKIFPGGGIPKLQVEDKPIIHYSDPNDPQIVQEEGRYNFGGPKCGLTFKLSHATKLNRAGFKLSHGPGAEYQVPSYPRPPISINVTLHEAEPYTAPSGPRAGSAPKHVPGKLLARTVIDYDQFYHNTPVDWAWAAFAPPVPIEANKTYVVVLAKPTTMTTNTIVYGSNAPSELAKRTEAHQEFISYYYNKDFGKFNKTGSTWERLPKSEWSASSGLPAFRLDVDAVLTPRTVPVIMPAVAATPEPAASGPVKL